MKPLARMILWCVGGLIVSVPVGIVVTLMLTPLWSWIETSFGIESIGHSGPAQWCYGITALVAIVAFCAVLLLRRRR